MSPASLVVSVPFCFSKRGQETQICGQHPNFVWLVNAVLTELSWTLSLCFVSGVRSPFFRRVDRRIGS